MTEPAEPVGPPRGEPLRVRIRRARPADRASVMAFAAKTWDGWDYIPHAWAEWIDATDGVLMVALPQRPVPGEATQLDAEGRPLDPDVPIAISRMALLSRSEGWVEGIRVDPRVRGRSVATQLQVAELTWAAAHDIQLIRYITGADNEGSHRLGARHGFHVICKLRGYVDAADAEEEEHPFIDDEHDRQRRVAARAVRRRTVANLETAGLVVDPASDASTLAMLWALVAADPTFRYGHGLYESRPWTAQELTTERFAIHLRRGEVLAERGQDSDAVTAVAIFRRGGVSLDDPTQNIALLAGEGRAALRLARAVRVRAGEPVRMRLPEPNPPLTAGMADEWALAGFPPRGHVNHVLERRSAPDEVVPGPDLPNLLAFEDEPRAVATPPEP